MISRLCVLFGLGVMLLLFGAPIARASNCEQWFAEITKIEGDIKIEGQCRNADDQKPGLYSGIYRGEVIVFGKGPNCVGKLILSIKGVGTKEIDASDRRQCRVEVDTDQEINSPPGLLSPIIDYLDTKPSYGLPVTAGRSSGLTLTVVDALRSFEIAQPQYVKAGREVVSLALTGTIVQTLLSVSANRTTIDAKLVTELGTGWVSAKFSQSIEKNLQLDLVLSERLKTGLNQIKLVLVATDAAPPLAASGVLNGSDTSLSTLSLAAAWQICNAPSWHLDALTRLQDYSHAGDRVATVILQQISSMQSKETLCQLLPLNLGENQ